MNEADYKEYIKEMTDLKRRMQNAEDDIQCILKEQKEHRNLLQQAEMKDQKMAGELLSIKTILEELKEEFKKRKIRLIDVSIAIAVLLTGALGVYVAIQANELTKIMIELSKQTIYK
jgi:predicted nuclease with TOPRIM domain